MTRELIYDFETLGQNTFECAVIDCAYYIFNRDRFLSDNPYTFDQLIKDIQYIKVSVADQVSNFGFKVEKEALEFWKKQDSKVKRRILPQKTDASLTDFFARLMKYINDNGKLNYTWTRSNTFDPIILWRIAKFLNATDLHDEMIPFWSIRDIRTYIDAITDFKKGMNNFIPVSDKDKWNEQFQMHNCVHDVAADILRLQTLSRVNHDLPINY